MRFTALGYAFSAWASKYQALLAISAESLQKHTPKLLISAAYVLNVGFVGWEVQGMVLKVTLQECASKASHSEAQTVKTMPTLVAINNN